MSTNSINNLSSFVQQVLGNALQNPGLTSGNGLSAINSSSLLPDTGRLSPFAQLLNTLQQLQQSDPAKYQQVTQQIATNLQNAAQTAQSDGSLNAAAQLNQLAADFTSASKSGQLPNVNDLAQALGGHHHHHHGHSDSLVAPSVSAGTTSQLPSQNDPLNPVSIILNTLSNAGVSLSKT